MEGRGIGRKQFRVTYEANHKAGSVSTNIDRDVDQVDGLYDHLEQLGSDGRILARVQATETLEQMAMRERIGDIEREDALAKYNTDPWERFRQSLLKTITLSDKAYALRGVTNGTAALVTRGDFDERYFTEEAYTSRLTEEVQKIAENGYTRTFVETAMWGSPMERYEAQLALADMLHRSLLKPGEEMTSLQEATLVCIKEFRACFEDTKRKKGDIDSAAFISLLSAVQSARSFIIRHKGNIDVYSSFMAELIGEVPKLIDAMIIHAKTGKELIDRYEMLFTLGTTRTKLVNIEAFNLFHIVLSRYAETYQHPRVKRLLLDAYVEDPVRTEAILQSIKGQGDLMTQGLLLSKQAEQDPERKAHYNDFFPAVTVPLFYKDVRNYVDELFTELDGYTRPKKRAFNRTPLGKFIKKYSKDEAKRRLIALVEATEEINGVSLHDAIADIDNIEKLFHRSLIDRVQFLKELSDPFPDLNSAIVFDGKRVSFMPRKEAIKEELQLILDGKRVNPVVPVGEIRETHEAMLETFVNQFEPPLTVERRVALEKRVQELRTEIQENLRFFPSPAGDTLIVASPQLNKLGLRQIDIESIPGSGNLDLNVRVQIGVWKVPFQIRQIPLDSFSFCTGEEYSKLAITRDTELIIEEIILSHLEALLCRPAADRSKQIVTEEGLPDDTMYRRAHLRKQSPGRRFRPEQAEKALVETSGQIDLRRLNDSLGLTAADGQITYVNSTEGIVPRAPVKTKVINVSEFSIRTT